MSAEVLHAHRLLRPSWRRNFTPVGQTGLPPFAKHITNDNFGESCGHFRKSNSASLDVLSFSTVNVILNSTTNMCTGCDRNLTAALHFRTERRERLRRTKRKQNGQCAGATPRCLVRLIPFHSTNQSHVQSSTSHPVPHTGRASGVESLEGSRDIIDQI